ncbi:MAG: hypothetical protein JWQ04_1738, partial [Pedosphaera sp.]|nr:hypothetical protein [Pedosphaera sp.]
MLGGNHAVKPQMDADERRWEMIFIMLTINM